MFLGIKNNTFEEIKKTMDRKVVINGIEVPTDLIKKITVTHYDGTVEYFQDNKRKPKPPRLSKNKVDRFKLVQDCFSKNENLTWTQLKKRLEDIYFHKYEKKLSYTYCIELVKYFKSEGFIINEPRGPYSLNI